MDAIQLYRSLLRSAHEFLEGTLADVTPEQFTWDPPGRAFSIAANYAHVLTSEDMAVHRLLAGKAMLAETTWAGRLGADEMPPAGPGGDLKAWSRRVKPDLAAMRSYGQAVYAASDAWLASATPADLARPLDMTAFGFGPQTALFVFTAILANASMHTGEISCLKGLQGGRGYPA